MSERGSFVTEYIYCSKCFEAIKPILIRNDKYLRGVIIPMWGNPKPEQKQFLPIIAGKVGGLAEREELLDFECEFCPEISKVICHDLRIAVLAECGEKIFLIHPGIEKPEILG